METMEVEERESKLQAGKDVLLAFQKKKDKKVKKKKPKTAAITANDESITISNDESMNGETPQSCDRSEVISIIDSGLAMDERPSWSTVTTANGNGTMTDNEAPENSVNETCPHNDQSHLTASLVAMETTLSNREKEMAEMKLQHSTEIDSLLKQQERIREELLQEQARSFAREINEIKEKLSLAGTETSNDDQMEAKRMHQLKNALKQLHEKEMEKAQLSHQEEKTVMREEFIQKMEEVRTECERKIEDNKKRLEGVANDQIKQIHSQFMVSYNELMKQKSMVEEERAKIEESLREAKEKVDVINKEKETLTLKVLELQRNHSVEVDAVRSASSDLERRLKEWKEKASDLQRRIAETEQHGGEGEGLETRIRELELQQVLSDKEIQEKNTVIEQLEERLTKEKETFDLKLAEMEETHRTAISEVESEYTEKVSVLEESITESSSSQASLEFAEVHMKELQQQLNAYRNQEMNHKTAMEKAKEEQEREVQLAREVGEAKCEKISIQHQQELDQLHQQITDLNETLKAIKLETEGVKSNVDATVDKAINETKSEYITMMTEQTNRHQQEIEKLKLAHVEEMATSLDTTKQQFETEKKNEIKRLQEENEAALSELEKSLTSAKEKAESAAHVASANEVEEQLKEVRSLQERLQKLETELTANAVQLSLTRSELDKERSDLDSARQSLKDTNEKYNEALGVADGLKQELEKEREESSKRYQEMLQVKEDEVATHQAHLTSCQLRINELTDELAQERSVSQTLKNDIETMSQNTQENVATTAKELSNVHTELQQAKERYSSLVEQWQDKESEHEKLRDELGNAQDSLTNQTKEYENKVTSLETQLLEVTEKLSTADTAQQEYDRKLQEMREQCDQLSMEKTNLTSQIEALEEQVAIRTDENTKLLMKDGNSQQTLHDAYKEKETALEELENEKQQHELMKIERDNLLIRISELELQLTDSTLEETCKELELKLKLSEESLATLNQQHSKQLQEAEERCRRLEMKLAKSQQMEGKVNSLMSSQSDVEKSLAKARQVLIEKLRQKELLEKDLHHHRTQLDRRQSEKQRLEELLFEKSKFEQELRNQREQLQFDLDNIEKRMKSTATGPGITGPITTPSSNDKHIDDDSL